MKDKRILVGDIGRILGFQGQYFYGFIYGIYNKPKLAEDLKSLKGDYHSFELNKEDAKIFLGRVVDWYRKDNYTIIEALITKALEYINK
jgi:hypothetical protein